jgi:hypothetical protein
MCFESEGESGDGAGDCDGAIANNGGFLVELAVRIDIHFAGGFCWSHFAIVEKSGFAAGETDEHEAASADVARGRFNYGKSEGSGYCGVYSIATALENFHSGLGSERLIGGDHTVSRTDGCSRPFLGNVRMIAEFVGGLGGGELLEERKNGKYAKTKKNFPSHGR